METQREITYIVRYNKGELLPARREMNRLKKNDYRLFKEVESIDGYDYTAIFIKKLQARERERFSKIY